MEFFKESFCKCRLARTIKSIDPNNNGPVLYERGYFGDNMMYIISPYI